ncbi:MAG: UDP-N-acetylmuramate dehydrogenase [Puniceicoccales bacterium]|jgi:UDP-N-acetylenolpyruvoylglucosamine reductase|nr:UDP-N-acetylmuramate dehydrogenase [Puniceicoccales bacterium]
MIFLAGIGGMGMAALAIYLRQMGKRVTGFDDCIDRETEFLLARCAIEVVPRPERLPNCEAFVHTSAIRDGDKLLRLAKESGSVAVYSRGEYVAKMLKGNRVLAIVGSHGKTTTAAYAIGELRARRFQFNYLMGGRFVGKDLPAHFCGALWTVAEIDESESSIDLFSPHVTLLLNLSMDHDAHYGSIDSLRGTVAALCERTEKTVLIGRGEKSLRPFHRCRKIKFFSTPSRPDHCSVEQFNWRNCAAALAAADSLCRRRSRGRDVPAFETVAVRRRQTVLHRSASVEVIADYAHHPVEVLAFLKHYWNGNSAIVFQPHRFSRTASHCDEFVGILKSHGPAVLMPTYGAFESFDPLGTGEHLSKMLADMGVAVPCLCGEGLVEHLDFLRKNLSVSRFLFVGAGSIFSEAKAFSERLKEESFGAARQKHFPLCPFRENVPMEGQCTMRVGGPARFFAEPRNLDELRSILRCAAESDLRYFVAGAGSNLLVDDGGFFGLLLRLRGSFWKRHRIGKDFIYLRCAIPMGRLADLCRSNAIGGYEFCGGIPGTVGGAVAMNAGAFSSAIGDFVEKLTVFRGGRVLSICGGTFSYRKSPLLEGDLLLSVKLRRTPHSDGEAIDETAQRMAKRRRLVQPSGSSAGSIFRNTPSIAAGELIEKAGLKGLQVGGVQISPKHGNFIVNCANGSCGDVLALIFLVKATVMERFNIDLSTEVCFLADFWVGPL